MYYREKKETELLLSRHDSLSGELRWQLLPQQIHDHFTTLSFGICLFMASTSHLKTLRSARTTIISFLTTSPKIWAHRETQDKQRDESFACELRKIIEEFLLGLLQGWGTVREHKLT